MAQNTKSPGKSRTTKSAAPRSRPSSKGRRDDDAADAFSALLQAEYWLFTAAATIAADADPAAAAAIKAIRHRVCEQLERLQPRAYRAFVAREGAGSTPPLAGNYGDTIFNSMSI